MPSLNRKIRLYRGIMPNEGENDYYHFTSVSDYLAALSSHLGLTLDIENYRIDRNILKIGSSSFRHGFTYVIETDNTDTSYFRAFKVRNEVDYSGIIAMTLEVDLWATYLLNCNFQLIHVTRSNLNLGRGVYDPVPFSRIASNDEMEHVPLGGHDGTGYVGRKYLLENELYIVFIANVVVDQSLDKLTNVTTTRAYATLISNIKNAVNDPTANMVDLAIKYVSGIYKAGTTSWLDNKVQIIKAYLIPSFILNTLGSWAAIHPITFTSKSEYKATDTDVVFFPLVPKREITSFLFDVSDDFDPDYKYYFGTYDDGLEIDRSTTDYRNYIIGYFGNSGVKVVIRQGDREKDITNAFEVGIEGTSTAADAGQDIARTGLMLTNLFGHMITAFKAGSDAKSASSLMVTLSGQANNYTASLLKDYFAGGGVNPSPVIGAGDGATTFSVPTSGTDRAFYPLYYVKYKSTRDEKANARVNGASFDVYVGSLRDLVTPTYEMLGSLTGFNRVFVAANVEVEGVPLDAEAYITNALRGGVYFKVI